MTDSRSRPAASSVAVQRFMSVQRTRDTKPEIRLRSALHRRGVRFRLHRADLPGRPDIVMPRTRLVVFVDGCFWHRCPIHYVPPKQNAEWWANKLSATVARDRRQDGSLREIGWDVMHVWEHEDVEAVADSIQVRWHQKR